GFHGLVLAGSDLANLYPPQDTSDQILADGFKAAARSHPETLIRALALPPQTNVIRRSAVLIAVGHWLTARFGKMLRLSEIGCSAGLNLHWDFYAMDAAGVQFGPRGSAVHLAPDWRGTPPVLCPAYIHEAQGVDLAPPDITSPDARRRLMSYLWPDQQDRLTLTQAGLSIAAQPDTDGTVTQGDALDWLPGRLTHKPPYLHLIYSTVAWRYLSDRDQARGAQMIADHGAQATDQAPLAWFQMENDGAPDSAALTLRLWPGDITLSLGRADFHGRWVDWTAPPP
ncbi:MAG: DUF2332 family protein, partial [Pseudomonadota bacterium]